MQLKPTTVGTPPVPSTYEAPSPVNAQLMRLVKPEFLSLVTNPANRSAFKIIRSIEKPNTSIKFNTGLTREQVEKYIDTFGLEGFSISDTEPFIASRGNISNGLTVKGNICEITLDRSVRSTPIALEFVGYLPQSMKHWCDSNGFTPISNAEIKVKRGESEVNATVFHLSSETTINRTDVLEESDTKSIRMMSMDIPENDPVDITPEMTVNDIITAVTSFIQTSSLSEDTWYSAAQAASWLNNFFQSLAEFEYQACSSTIERPIEAKDFENAKITDSTRNVQENTSQSDPDFTQEKQIEIAIKSEVAEVEKANTYSNEIEKVLCRLDELAIKIDLLNQKQSDNSNSVKGTLDKLQGELDNVNRSMDSTVSIKRDNSVDTKDRKAPSPFAGLFSTRN